LLAIKGGMQRKVVIQKGGFIESCLPFPFGMISRQPSMEYGEAMPKLSSKPPKGISSLNFSQFFFIHHQSRQNSTLVFKTCPYQEIAKGSTLSVLVSEMGSERERVGDFIASLSHLDLLFFSPSPYLSGRFSLALLCYVNFYILIN